MKTFVDKATSARVLLALAGLLLAATAAATSGDLLDALLQRAHQQSTTQVVPDDALRRWDPITVFFTGARGKPGPEDHPERVLDRLPDHPGAWTWLDARTLQFRPAEPWTPLSTVSLKVDGRSSSLFTVASPPLSSAPADGSRGLDPFDTIELTFADPLPTETLSRLTRVELRPLPGLSDEGLVVLDQDDFEIKTLQRRNAGDPVTYALVFTEPIARGLQVKLHLGLSLDVDAHEAVTTLTLSTSEPFRTTQLGCGSHRVPLAPSGSIYAQDQSLTCSDPRLSVRFNAEPAELGPVLGRNLVRFEPAVENLVFDTDGRELTVRGDFAIGVNYRVALEPTEGVRDRADRPLQMDGSSVAWVRFAEKPPYFRWGAGQGIVERFGSHRVPIQGRGISQVDLRVYQVDPRNRELWPFPSSPIAIDESQRPPGPGEEPAPIDPLRRASTSDLRKRLHALGSPGFSGLVNVGLEGAAAHSGLDLGEAIERLSGRDGTGHYLVGVRRLDGEQTRSWMRVQVTDLALSTLETGDEVRFLVTRLSTGRPVVGARIQVDAVVGSSKRTFDTVVQGTTDSNGTYVFQAPGTGSVRTERLVVSSGSDVLVLDAHDPPDAFGDGRWRNERGHWLDWAWNSLSGRVEQARLRGHLFSERPMYRPEEDVHLKGYLRSRYQGDLTKVSGTGTVEVSGPGGSSWKLPVTLTNTGSFYARWSEDDLPTGVYQARIRYHDKILASTDFQVEAYRLPTFEVDLSAADNATTVPNDQAFEVIATGSYYAGGKVALRPIRWRVNQFPYTWEPPVDGLEGFRFSSDGRYSRSGRFDSTPALERGDRTDRVGEARLRLDPGIEPTAQPRTYVIEAEVTGADEQTVTATHRIHAVPAFVLGLKAPRFRDTADVVPIEAVAVGPDGSLIEGRDVTVRLIQRQWHSVLQASDFSDGVARYVTDTVDVPISEQVVKTGARVSALQLPISEAGVYIVELEARDALGRVQVVSVDLYAGGKGEVTWAKSEAGVFELTPDQASYEPGDNVKMLIRSPFQSGNALVVIEAPKGNQYKNVSISGGKGTVSFGVQEGWVPKIPVHVLLRRGRVADAGTVGGTDLGKPQTLGATRWLTIEPTEHTVEVALAHPERAMPGETIDVTVSLKDPRGRPLSGEVTLWLVDQAVLALAPEKPLDPRPDFLPSRRSRFKAHDTRNLAFGALPFSEMPGGDSGEESADEDGVLDQTSVRQDFKSVPYYEPVLKVGSSGTATVKVELPDNLTVFKLRAKASSGQERFGFAKSSMAVRLPVLLQADLPRFVRPGDRLEVAALGRVVEGEGGAGMAEVKVEGLQLSGETQRSVAWDRDEAVRFAWPVEVPTPPAGEGGALSRRQVTVTIGAKRSADGAGDAVRVQLPLLDDRRPRVERAVLELPVGGSARLEGIDEAVRPGSLRRELLVSDHPALAKMAAAMDVFVQRPARSVGQQLDRGRAWVGLGGLRSSLGLEGEELVDVAVSEALASIPGSIDSRGLVAAWPGGRGQVGLTAEALRFCVDAQEAGYDVDPKLRDRLVRTLKSSLRSDYRYFLDGGSWLERSQSLEALAAAGVFEAGYFTELADRTRYLGPRGTAHVLLAAELGGKGSDPLAARLTASLDDEVVVGLFQGTERYQGLKSEGWRSPWIDSSEALTLATLTQSLVRRDDTKKLDLVVDGLVRLGGEDGWGGRADAPALLALAERMKRRSSVPVAVQAGGVSLTTAAGVGRAPLPNAEPVQVKHVSGPDGVGFASTRWIPAEPGSQADARNAGFVVSRDHAVYVEGSSTPSRVRLDEGGRELQVALGGIVEDHVQVVSPEDRTYVAIEVPLAAGLELMNPALATSGADATPSRSNSREPTYVIFGDASVTWFFEKLPKGTHDFYFRSRATTRGTFIQPPAVTETVYDLSIVGSSPGASVVVE